MRLSLLLTVSVLAACTRQDPTVQLMAAQCGACHRIPGIPAAAGRVGPSLEGVGRQQIIAGHFANSPQLLTRWIEHPQELLPGNAMPDMHLSHAQAREIADYLYRLD